MPKYTKEFKIKLVMEYLSGKSVGRMMVAKKYDIPEGGYITKLDSKI
ncbi:transposase [Anaerococcus senegalensis]|nr:transposase [Anaerococcus senegalensis]